MGVLIAELWGLHGLFRAPSLQEMVLKIFRTLGSPTGNELAYFSTLPLFSQQMPHTVAPDRRTVFKKAPEELVVVVTGLLRLCPADRWHAAKAHDFLAAEQEASAVASRQLALDLSFSPGLPSAAAASTGTSSGCALGRERAVEKKEYKICKRESTRPSWPTPTPPSSRRCKR